MSEEQKLGEQDRAVAAVVKILSRRLRTRAEVRKILLGKGFAGEVIECALDKAQEYGYLDDAQYAGAFVRTYSHGGGRRKLEFDMRSRGVGAEDIATALGALSSDDEREAAAALAAKYMRGKERTRENAAKLYRYLAGRGFDGDIINAIIGETE